MTLTATAARLRATPDEEPTIRVRHRATLGPRPWPSACPTEHPVRPVDMVYPDGYDHTDLGLFMGLAFSPDGDYLWGALFQTTSLIVRWSWPDLNDPEVMVDDPAAYDMYGLYVDDTHVWWVEDTGVGASATGVLRRRLIAGGPIEDFVTLIGEADDLGGWAWYNYFLVGSNGKLYTTFYRSITSDTDILQTGYLEIDPEVPGEYTIRQFSYANESDALYFVDGFPITVADDGAIWQPSVGPDYLALTRFDPVTGVFTSTSHPTLDVIVAAARDGNVYGSDFSFGEGKRVLVTPDMEVLDDPCFEGVDIPARLSVSGLSITAESPTTLAFAAVTSVDVPIKSSATAQANLLLIRADVPPDTPVGWIKTVDTGVISDGTTACVYERDADLADSVTFTFPSPSTGYVQNQAPRIGWTATARAYGVPGDTSQYSPVNPDAWVFFRSFGVGGGGSKAGIIYPPESITPYWYPLASWPIGWVVWEFDTTMWATWGTTPPNYWVPSSAEPAFGSADHRLQVFISRDDNPDPEEDVFIVSAPPTRLATRPSGRVTSVTRVGAKAP